MSEDVIVVDKLSNLKSFEEFQRFFQNLNAFETRNFSTITAASNFKKLSINFFIAWIDRIWEFAYTGNGHLDQKQKSEFKNFANSLIEIVKEGYTEFPDTLRRALKALEDGEQCWQKIEITDLVIPYKEHD